jgi:hypothetical protein
MEARGSWRGARRSGAKRRAQATARGVNRAWTRLRLSSLAHVDSISAQRSSAPSWTPPAARGATRRRSRARIPVVGVDRDLAQLRALAQRAREDICPIRVLARDLEASPSLPWRPPAAAPCSSSAICTAPLCAARCGELRPGGLLLYETFTTAQRELGYGPRNPAFLLEPGELPQLFPGLRVLSIWEGLGEGERPAALARLAAVRPASGA